MYYPISYKDVKSIPILNEEEDLVDLLEINNSRIKPLVTFNTKYTNTYKGYSRIRKSVYEKLLKMLTFSPSHLGIAYFEGFRPLSKQKGYFDNKFREILAKTNDKQLAY